MINRCIGCYYHDCKENVCTHGSPIFLDDVCTDYQDSEFVMQIKAEAIDELLKQVKKEEMWLLRVVGSNQNINIAFSGIYAKAEQLKSQDSMK